MLNKTRKTPLKREPIATLEDLRDDCIALFLNSKLNYRQVHAAGGPTPQTISKWLHKETLFPRLDTIRGFLRAVGADLVVTSRLMAETWTEQPQHERLDTAPSILPPRMPPRKRLREKLRAKRRERRR